MRAKYHRDIHTCPVKAYLDAPKTGAKSLLIKGRYRQDRALQAYDELQRQFFEEFGISKEYLNYLRKARSALKEYSKVFRGDKSRKPIASIKLAEAQKMLSVEAVDLPILIGRISKEMGFPINPAKTSVFEFFSYVKLLQ